MAESWMEWLNGTPEQKSAALAKQQEQFDAISRSPAFRNAIAAHTRGYDDGMTDPRAYAMRLVRDQLTPSRPSDAYDTMASTADYFLDVGGRPRDTLFRSVQEASSGNPLKAAELLGRAPLSAVVPSMAAGRPGAADDWRQHAGPTQGIVIDMLTDPANYATFGMKPALQAGYKALKAVDRATDAMRYGRAVPARLIDSSGSEIRRLLNAQ